MYLFPYFENTKLRSFSDFFYISAVTREMMRQTRKGSWGC